MNTAALPILRGWWWLWPRAATNDYDVPPNADDGEHALLAEIEDRDARIVEASLRKIARTHRSATGRRRRDRA